MACLVLKEFSRLDYPGLAAHLADHPDLRALIGLEAVPHFTTFQKAAQRLLAAVPGGWPWSYPTSVLMPEAKHWSSTTSGTHRA